MLGVSFKNIYVCEMNLGLGLQSIWVEVSVATGSLCFILPNGLGKKNIYYEAMLSMWWNILAFILVLNGKKIC